MTKALPPLFAILLLAGCAATPPRVAPAPTPPKALEPPAPPVDVEWRDLPLTAGRWIYAKAANGSTAAFGAAGATPALTLRCDRSTRTIRIARSGAMAGAITITTSYSGRDWPVVAGAGGTFEASIMALDPFLDRIAFSRGRVSFAMAGLPLLVTPAWAEPARVIEDCRS